MEPFVALMRRYCIELTTGHDLSAVAEVMEPSYVLHMGGHRVTPRDGGYTAAVIRQFDQFPGLALTVEQIVTNGDRLALRFAEHGASVRHRGRLAAWQGIGLYRWNGRRLTACRVEQDYYARRQQLETGVPNPVPRPAHDPWATRAAPTSENAQRVVAGWLDAYRGQPGKRVTANDSWVRGWREPVIEGDMYVDDLFSAGDTVAFYGCLSGVYRGGLPGLDGHAGTPARLWLSGLATVSGDAVDQVTLVSDRHGLVRQLTGPRGAVRPA